MEIREWPASAKQAYRNNEVAATRATSFCIMSRRLISSRVVCNCTASGAKAAFTMPSGIKRTAEKRSAIPYLATSFISPKRLRIEHVRLRDAEQDEGSKEIRQRLCDNGENLNGPFGRLPPTLHNIKGLECADHYS